VGPAGFAQRPRDYESPKRPTAHPPTTRTALPAPRTPQPVLTKDEPRSSCTPRTRPPGALQLAPSVKKSWSIFFTLYVAVVATPRSNSIIRCASCSPSTREMLPISSTPHGLPREAARGDQHALRGLPNDQRPRELPNRLGGDGPVRRNTLRLDGDAVQTQPVLLDDAVDPTVTGMPDRPTSVAERPPVPHRDQQPHPHVLEERGRPCPQLLEQLLGSPNGGPA
jgi:hypothetical protein